MTQRLVQTLGGAEHARVGFYMEGGYDRTALADSVQSTLDALHTCEPLAHPCTDGRSLKVRHAAELARIERLQREFWQL